MPLTGRLEIPQTLQSGAIPGPDEGQGGAALVMLKIGNGPDPGTPKTGLLFLLTLLPPQPKSGAAASPLNCRVKIPTKQPDGENTHFNAYFL